MSDPMIVESPSATGAAHRPEDESFLESLSEPLRGFANEAVPVAAGQPLPAANARMDRLEIQLRSHLLELTQTLLANPASMSARIRVEDYWKSCLQVCLHLVRHGGGAAGAESPYHGMGGAVVRKLPFLMLEDILETLPLHLVHKLWDTMVEPSIPILCGSDSTSSSTSASLLWVKTSHLVWIRVCNKLLKKLSGGEWAGRILLSLASVFPLNERSAMNVLGSFHVDNITTYETLEEFQAHEEGAQEQQQEKGNTEDTLLEPPKKVKKDYAFYETFWSVQDDFCNPNAIELSKFIERMQAILASLESNAFPKQQQQQQRSKDKTSKPPSGTTTSDGHHKYLTNSQLLHLQLRDPELRIHFLTQFLIVESYLSDKGVGSSRLLRLKLTEIAIRARDLLKKTPPNGAAHLKTIEWLLSQRESIWRKWKKNKCMPDLEKKAPAVDKEEQDGASPRKRKHSLMDGPLGSSRDEDEQDDGLFERPLDVQNELPDISRRMVEDVVPELPDHLQDYVEALDPEAGIEAEYHPRNDKLFSWRAMRLLTRRHLGHFHMIRRRDGDFERLVRHIYKEERGEDIPGEPPEEDKLEEEDAAAQDVNNDNVMNGEEHSEVVDDASVGSPMDTEPHGAKEEEEGGDQHKSDFEKAAMEEEAEMLRQEDEEGEKTKSSDDDAKAQEDEKKTKRGQKAKPDVKEKAAEMGSGRRGRRGRGDEGKDDHDERRPPPDRSRAHGAREGRRRNEPSGPPGRGARDDHVDSRQQQGPGRGRRRPDDRDEHRRGRSTDDRGGGRRRPGGGRRSY